MALSIFLRPTWFVLFFALMSGGCALLSSPSHELKAGVAQVLRDNPDLIIEALAHNEQALLLLIQQASVRQQTRDVLEQRLAELKDPFNPDLSGARPIRGNAAGPITIVEYGDFECPYCATAAKTVEKVIEQHKNQVRFILKHNPLDFHPVGKIAAVYFEAIAQQDAKKAWQFHDRVFAGQERLKEGESWLRDIVATLQLDQQRLEQDLVGDLVKHIIEKDKVEAFVFGFNGTPVFVINGVSLRGAYPAKDFEEIIQMVQ